MAEIKKMGYCVNGEWKESKAEKYMDVTDSSTGEVIAQVPCCTPDEVEEAIASAQAAFPEWSSLSLAKRQQYMFRWRDVLYAHKEELSVLCAKELGWYISQVFANWIGESIWTEIRSFSKQKKKRYRS